MASAGGGRRRRDGGVTGDMVPGTMGARNIVTSGHASQQHSNSTSGTNRPYCPNMVNCPNDGDMIICRAQSSHLPTFGHCYLSVMLSITYAIILINPQIV